jgi:hypothetical protein
VILSFLSSISNRKSSKIGSTVLALITPLICCKCFNSDDDETINFILTEFFVLATNVLQFGNILSIVIGLRQILGAECGYCVN